MILLPALRFLMSPLPPAVFAARFFAAVIRPPLLFFTVITPSLVLQTGPLERASQLRYVETLSLGAFGHWPTASPGNRAIPGIKQATHLHVCWIAHIVIPNAKRIDRSQVRSPTHDDQGAGRNGEDGHDDAQS